MTAAVRKLTDRVKELERQPRGSDRELAGSLVERAVETAGVRVVTEVVDVPDARLLRELSDRVRQALGDSAAVVLGGAAEGRVHLVANVSPSVVERGVKAGDVVRVAAEIVGGGGGGRDTMAQAGGALAREAARSDRCRAAGDRARSLVSRVLALDHGSARCGCAVSDPTGTLATPLRSVERPTRRPGSRPAPESCGRPAPRAWWSACRSRCAARRALAGCRGARVRRAGRTRRRGARGAARRAPDDPSGGARPRERGRGLAGGCTPARELAGGFRPLGGQMRSVPPIPPDEPDADSAAIRTARELEAARAAIRAAREGAGTHAREAAQTGRATARHARSRVAGKRPLPQRPSRRTRGRSAHPPRPGTVPERDPAGPPEALVPPSAPHRPRRTAAPGWTDRRRRPEAPPPGRVALPARRRRVLLAIVALVLVGLVWFLVALFQPFEATVRAPVTVTIPKGSGVSQIGDLLAKHGVVSSGFLFRDPSDPRRPPRRPEARHLRPQAGHELAWRGDRRPHARAGVQPRQPDDPRGAVEA